MKQEEWRNNMKEQKYILKNQNSFELKDIFECGQCFRWNEEEDGKIGRASCRERV